MTFMRHFSFCNSYDPGGYNKSHKMGLAGGVFKIMIAIALSLIALGVLVLIFPLILAVFVAGFFFLIAAFILIFATKLFIAGRRNSILKHSDEIDIIDIDDVSS